jgi:type II secretory pathway pseudopilin PulG
MRKKFQISNFKFQTYPNHWILEIGYWKLDIPRAKTSGFTLVELLMYMGLLSILLVALTTIFVAIIDTQLNAQATSYVAQDGRYIYSRLIADIHKASSVQSPQNLGDTTNSLQMTISSASASYSLADGNLILTDTTGSHVMNSFGTTISDLSFTRIGNVNGKHTFRINFTVSGNRVADSSPEVKDFQTTAGLR